MAEKTFETPVKERFEFVLSINGNIICQRYFSINNFQEKSLGSVHLMEAMTDCYEMIDKDLKEKTNIYNWLTAPQVFQNKEEMEKLAGHGRIRIPVPGFAMLRDSDEIFLWNGTEMEPYDGKQFNRWDYFDEEQDTPWVLKFAFLDNGVEVRSISWDGTRYPKFIRTNIDLSNSKNRFKEGLYNPFWALVVDELNEGRQDLISQIKRRISWACSGTTVRYFSKLHYGDAEYDIDFKSYNERQFLGMRKKK